MEESIAPTHRICRKCHQEKLLSDFVFHLECFYGRTYECQACKILRGQKYSKKYRRENGDKRQTYLANTIEKRKKYNKEDYQKRKHAVIDAYGGKCVCCGEKHATFLTIDHIYNDGYLHRSEKGRFTGVHIYRWLEKNGFPKGRVQLLCYNCNGAKQHDPEGHRAAHKNARKVEPPAQLPIWGTDGVVPVGIGNAASEDVEPQMGQLWSLGEHRLLCGDCTDAAQVARVMGGELAAIVSDPPYGIMLDSRWLSALNVKRGKPAKRPRARSRISTRFRSWSTRRWIWMKSSNASSSS